MFPALRIAVAIVAVVAVQVVAPGSAAAQFGGLAKKAKQAAKKEADAKVQQAMPYTPLPAPEFNDRVLEITGGRVDQLLKGFEAEAAYAKTAPKEYDEQVKTWERDRKEYDKANESYSKAYDKYTECKTRFDSTEQQASEANEKTLDAMSDDEFDAYVEALSERGEKVARDVEAGKNDPATLREREQYQRDAAAMLAEQKRRAQKAMGAMGAEQERERTEDARLVKACGEAPRAPTPPLSPVAGPEGVLAGKGAEAAGLTPEQYAIVRERVMVWEAEGGRPRRMGFSQTELDALDARSADLKQAFARLRKAGVPL